MPAKPRFPGFPRSLPRFLRRLARNNSRDWFEAHRPEYQESYVEPARAFVEAIEPELLRHEGLGASAELPHPSELFGPEAVPYVIERFRELRPLQQWLVRTLAQ